MTPSRALRVAWAGAIVATAAGLLYLSVAPIPSSPTVDRSLTITIALVGAVVGVVAEMRIEQMIRSRRTSASGDTKGGTTETEQLTAHSA